MFYIYSYISSIVVVHVLLGHIRTIMPTVVIIYTELSSCTVMFYSASSRNENLKFLIYSGSINPVTGTFIWMCATLETSGVTNSVYVAVEVPYTMI